MGMTIGERAKQKGRSPGPFKKERL